MLLYLVRHGQSEWNKANIHQTPDVPLSDDGLKQAEFLAKRLKNIHFDLIYSSPIKRARQTAEIINRFHNSPIEFWEDISEWKSPTQIRGKAAENPEASAILTSIFESLRRGDRDYKFSDEESFEELSTRAKKVLKHLEEKHKDQTILCVSHGTMIKSIVSQVVFGDDASPEIFVKMKEHMWIQNTGVTICEKTIKRGWTLNTWNDITHLDY
jgi:broad specificity phosphatase PhoE